jgi:NADPH:quinone reductase-like Zn-dependent oxidoreductase
MSRSGDQAAVALILSYTAYQMLHRVAQVMPLNEAAAAHHHIEDRAVKGKIVLRVSR